MIDIVRIISTRCKNNQKCKSVKLSQQSTLTFVVTGLLDRSLWEIEWKLILNLDGNLYMNLDGNVNGGKLNVSLDGTLNENPSGNMNANLTGNQDGTE